MYKIIIDNSNNYKPSLPEVALLMFGEKSVQYLNDSIPMSKHL